MNNGHKETILFVDDEKNILEIALEYFQSRGYRPLIARNGLEALEILQKEKIDCCFTDINMPEMNGLELAEIIRKKDNTIPVIIMTGNPSLDNTIRTLKNGVVDYLIKPVNLKQMEICIKRVLRERQFFVENILLKKEVEGKERLEKINQELLRKVEELRILNKILSEFAVINSTSDVFNRVVEMGMEIAVASETSFYIVSDDLKKPFKIASSLNGKNGKELELESYKSILINELKSSNDIIYVNSEIDPIGKLIIETAHDGLPLLISENNNARGIPSDINSLMAIPLKIRNKVFGVLTALRQNNIYASFNERDLYYLSFITQNAAHTIENHALYENIYENFFATLYALVKAIEARDPYTQQHSIRVTGIAITLAKTLNCSLEEIDILNFSGRLHDIGKIGIRDNILLKPGPLTKEEFEKIKEHPVIGANIVGNLGLWDQEKTIIRSHHERFDGTGYPDNLKGEKIPFLSRILSVADVYDALASDRAYRKKMEESQIIKIIVSGKGSQFDPKIVEIFLKLYNEGQIS